MCARKLKLWLRHFIQLFLNIRCDRGAYQIQKSPVNKSLEVVVTTTLDVFIDQLKGRADLA
jgi:hypothetical protein